MKRSVFLLLLFLIFSLIATGCAEKEPYTTEDLGEAQVDYSRFAFVGTSWTRDAENDTETIRFGADGRFTYYCACGNPVNDSDLCESYTYDDATKTITLNCFETTEEMITVIKLIHCDENELQLDFNGEVRNFVK